jgi:hypothetical protein
MRSERRGTEGPEDGREVVLKPPRGGLQIVGLVGCVGSNPKFARGCLIGSPKVQEAVMGKDWNARVSQTMKG